MRLTIAYFKIKKRNLVLINNDTYQRETLSERLIRQPLKKLSSNKTLETSRFMCLNERNISLDAICAVI